MKTEERLLEQMLHFTNLQTAYERVVKNKGAVGIDGVEYTELGAYLGKYGKEIKEQIRNKKYKPQPVKRVEIPKADGGVRNLGIPTVVDRFIQQAIL